MSGLAELLHNMGAKVSGSDMAVNSHVEHLRKEKITVEIGHKAENVGDVDVVVYSSAVPSNNPEIREARRRKIPIIPRAEVLSEVMRLKRGIAIGGSHGKTTTTSMAASIFLNADRDPTVVVGGRLDLIKSTSYLGKGEWLIAEADESDGSFLKLSPEIVIITNIDDDHLDYYKTFENLQMAFVEFARKVPFYGVAIVCGDGPAPVRELFKDFNKRILFYGFDSHNDYRLVGDRGVYEIWKQGHRLGSLRLQIPGRHNALNGLAALIAGLESEIDFKACVEGLARYEGVDRRFQHRGQAGGIDVYDDYGHHPTEVAAVLAAAREKFPDRRIVVAFQPHRYSRTQLCWDGFLKCFDQADQVFLLDIYPAGEKPIDGISSKKLASSFTDGKVVYLADAMKSEGKSLGKSSNKPTGKLASKPTSNLAAKFAGSAALLTQLRPGDVLLTMGAGDIWKLGPDLLARL